MSGVSDNSPWDACGRNLFNDVLLGRRAEDAGISAPPVPLLPDRSLVGNMGGQFNVHFANTDN